MFFSLGRQCIRSTRCSRQYSTSVASKGTAHTKGSIWAEDAWLPPLVYHPQSHGIPAATLHFRSHHPDLLNLFTYLAVRTASALTIPVSRPVYLPTQRTLWTVPRGPFAHKKSQENFDRKVHKRAIKAWDAHPETIGVWIHYLETYHVGGVGLRAIRWERAPVGFGKARLNGLAGQLEAIRRTTARGRVAALGEEIVQTEARAGVSSLESLQ
ncbi:ribosomal protein S10 domain-containing protein [Gautieria morchelliformis]|nr:ribosomal protein S10 domain-containing protein [Gautieria morchelliformis]